MLKKLTTNGMTVVMVSHDIEFCAKFTDKCGMLFDGRVTSEDTPRAFFAGKSFYTTAASRMSRGIIPGAVLTEDIIFALGGKSENYEEKALPINISTEKEEKASPKLMVKNLASGIIFTICFILFALATYKSPMGYQSYILQGASILSAGLALFNFIPQAPLCSNEAKMIEKNVRRLSKRTLVSAFLILLTIPLTIFIGMSYLGDRKYFFISIMIIFQTFLPFMLVFEKRKPNAREIIIISVLSAIAVTGRFAFTMLPQFKPVLAIIIISGVCLGGEAGFLVGAITAFVSNIYLGQGPWTPWQMFTMGIVGFIAGIIFKKGIMPKNRLSLCIFGGIATILIYGGIMNPVSVIMYYDNPTLEMILTAYAYGLPVDIIHAVSTVFFLWFGGPPMLEKLQRIKTKYGI